MNFFYCNSVTLTDKCYDVKISYNEENLSRTALVEDTFKKLDFGKILVFLEGEQEIKSL